MKKLLIAILALVVAIGAYFMVSQNKAGGSDPITDEQALAAVQNYCYTQNHDLAQMADSGDYEIGFTVDSSDDEQVVVLYRSYTAAEVRYYIDRATGETYVTEFVDGITAEEERTDETFNIRDYIAEK